MVYDISEISMIMLLLKTLFLLFILKQFIKNVLDFSLFEPATYKDKSIVLYKYLRKNYPLNNNGISKDQIKNFIVCWLEISANMNKTYLGLISLIIIRSFLLINIIFSLFEIPLTNEYIMLTNFIYLMIYNCVDWFNSKSYYQKYHEKFL